MKDLIKNTTNWSYKTLLLSTVLLACQNKSLSKKTPPAAKKHSVICIKNRYVNEYISKFKQEDMSIDERTKKISLSNLKSPLFDSKLSTDCMKSKKDKKNVVIQSVRDIKSDSIRSPMLPINVIASLIDYNSLKNDFDFLNTKKEKDIKKWLINNLGFISVSQIYKIDFRKLKATYPDIKDTNVDSFAKKLVGTFSDEKSFALQKYHYYFTKKTHDDIQKITALDHSSIKFGYRPYKYGRALYIPAYNLNTKTVQTIFDVKGVGAIFPRRPHHETGLLTVNDAIKETMIEKILQEMNKAKPSGYKVSPIYAVFIIDLENLIKKEGKYSALIIRKAINRKYNGRSSELTNALSFEMFLRSIGLTSSYPIELKSVGKKYWGSNLQGGIDEKTMVDFGHFYFVEKNRNFNDILGPGQIYNDCKENNDSDTTRIKCLEMHKKMWPQKKGYVKKPMSPKLTESLSKNFKNKFDEILEKINTNKFKEANTLFQEYISNIKKIRAKNF